jgi:hypothetical protein
MADVLFLRSNMEIENKDPLDQEWVWIGTSFSSFPIERLNDELDSMRVGITVFNGDARPDIRSVGDLESIWPSCQYHKFTATEIKEEYNIRIEAIRTEMVRLNSVCARDFPQPGRRGPFHPAEYHSDGESNRIPRIISEAERQIRDQIKIMENERFILESSRNYFAMGLYTPRRLSAQEKRSILKALIVLEYCHEQYSLSVHGTAAELLDLLWKFKISGGRKGNYGEGEFLVSLNEKLVAKGFTAYANSTLLTDYHASTEREIDCIMLLLKTQADLCCDVRVMRARHMPPPEG